MLYVCYIKQLWSPERIKIQRLHKVPWDFYFCYWLYMQNSHILWRWEVEWKPEEIASISENVTISDFAKVVWEMGVRLYKSKVFSHGLWNQPFFFFLFSLSTGAATTHIYILDVVLKKWEMNFQIFFLLHCLFITVLLHIMPGCKMIQGLMSSVITWENREAVG